jgi:hypothetical protein
MCSCLWNEEFQQNIRVNPQLSPAYEHNQSDNAENYTRIKNVFFSAYAIITLKLSDRFLSAKLVTTFADRGCRVVSATHPLRLYFCSQSATELYRPGYRCLSAKLVTAFADRGCRVVSATHPLRLYSCSQSASELYRPGYRCLSAKIEPTFVYRGCHVVSVSDPYGHILDF